MNEQDGPIDENQPSSSDLVAGGWNYRVMRRKHPSQFAPDGFEEEFGIYEAWYDTAGKVNGWSTDAMPLVAESLEGLRWVHEKIAEALAKPVLDYDVTEGESNESAGSCD